MLTDDENTNQLVSSIQKDNLQKHEKLVYHLKDGIIIIIIIIYTFYTKVKNYKTLLYINNSFLIFSVEKASKELINNTLNFNRSFKMDFHEKYSKYDSVKHVKDNTKFKFNKRVSTCLLIINC